MTGLNSSWKNVSLGNSNVNLERQNWGISLKFEASKNLVRIGLAQQGDSS